VDDGPVSSGVHHIAFQAEGVPGGCNTGTLSSWSGSVTIETSLAWPSARDPADALGTVVFASTVTSFGWGYHSAGCYIAADGTVYAYRFDRGDAAGSSQPDAHGSYDEAELLDRFSRHRTRLGVVAPTELADRTQAFEALKTEQYAQGAARSAPDQAMTSLVGYRRIAGTNRYAPVVLAESGGSIRVNVAPGAEPLTTWLRGALRSAGCA